MTTAAAAGYYNSLFEVTIGGGGHFNSPLRVTIDYLTTSSFKSTKSILPFGSLIVPTIYYINFPILLAYKVELWVGNLLGKSVYPMTFTLPSWLYNSPGLHNSQLPPVSAAKSTIIDPYFIFSTNSLESNFGAGLLGIKAVVIMISTSLAYFINKANSASKYSFPISLAYPPIPDPSTTSPLILTSKNSAPHDLT